MPQCSANPQCELRAFSVKVTRIAKRQCDSLLVEHTYCRADVSYARCSLPLAHGASQVTKLAHLRIFNDLLDERTERCCGALCVDACQSCSERMIATEATDPVVARVFVAVRFVLYWVPALC